MLLNLMLICIFQEDKDLEWKYGLIYVYMDYIQHCAPLPPPLNLIPNPRWIINKITGHTCDGCADATLNQVKMNSDDTTRTPTKLLLMWALSFAPITPNLRWSHRHLRAKWTPLWRVIWHTIFINYSRAVLINLHNLICIWWARI